MLILSNTTDAIEVQLGEAHTTNPAQCVASWRDNTTSALAPDRSLNNTNGVTAVDLVTGPASSTQRVIDYITVMNNDTVQHVTTIKYDANGTEYKLIVVTLLAGETLQYTSEHGWSVLSTAGLIKRTFVSAFIPVTSGWTTVVLSADQVNNNGTANTMEDVTGLSFAVTAGTRYMFRALIPYTAAATTTGSRWSINGPAITELYYRSQYSLTAATVTVNEGLSTYDAPAASNATSAATTANMASIEGMLLPSANGTLIVRHASEVLSSAITAKQGAILQWIAV